MLPKPSEVLFRIACKEAVRFQKEAGRSEKGIVSTQVKGLCFAIGKFLDILDESARQSKENYKSKEE